MANTRFHAAAIAAPLLIAAMAACGSPTDANGNRVSLVPLDASVAPFEVAEVVVRGVTLAADSYAGRLGGTSVTAGRSSDSTLAFVVPRVSAGPHTLSITIGDAVAEVTFTIAAGLTVSDPAAYLGEVEAAVEAGFVEMEAAIASGPTFGADATNLAADIAMARGSLAAARAEFNAMTPDEQREAASILRANYEVKAGLMDASSSSLRASAVFGPDLRLCGDPNIPLTVEEAEACADRSTSKLSAAMAYVRNLFDQDAYACAQAAEEAALKGLRVRIRTFLKHTVNGCHYARFSQWNFESWKASAFPTTPKFFWEEESESADFSASIAAAPVVRFTYGAPAAFTPRINFRPMIASDIGRVPAATAQASLFRDLAAAWTRINTLLPAALRQRPATLESVTSAPSRELKYPATRLKLGPVTPSTVTGTASVSGSEWTVTFNAADRSSEIPFTFTVIYDGGRFGSDTTVIPGILGDSVPVYVAAVVGRWSMTNVEHTSGFRDTWHAVLHPEIRDDFPDSRRAVIQEQPYLTGIPCSSPSKLVGDWCESETSWNVRAQDGGYYLWIGYSNPVRLTMPITEYVSYGTRYVKN